MRVFALFAMLASPAAADPEPAGKSVQLPDIVKESIEAVQQVDKSGVVGMDGVLSAGIVITPPYHPDAEPVSKGGIWHVPPDPNDPMVLIPGTNQLRARVKAEPWLPRDLSRSLKRGADRVWDVLLPKL
jgi:hypothetical protein